MRQGYTVFVDLKCKNEPRVSSPLLHRLSFSWEGPTPVMFSPQFQVSNSTYVVWEPQEHSVIDLLSFPNSHCKFHKLFFSSTLQHHNQMWKIVTGMCGLWVTIHTNILCFLVIILQNGIADGDDSILPATPQPWTSLREKAQLHRLLGFQVGRTFSNRDWWHTPLNTEPVHIVL